MDGAEERRGPRIQVLEPRLQEEERERRGGETQEEAEKEAEEIEEVRKMGRGGKRRWEMNRRR